MEIAIALFPQLTALDAIGPYEVLQRLPGATVTFVAEHRGEIRTDNGFLGLTADKTFDEVPNPDVIVVPGGVGMYPIVEQGGPLIDWVKSAHETTTFTTSVCTGSHVLGAAGLLDGLTAATHWATYDQLEATGAVATKDRVVEHLEHRIVTAAGVSSGIDMALRLSELLIDELAAKAMQLMIEYDPQPPFDNGHRDKCGDDIIERVAIYYVDKQ